MQLEFTQRLAAGCEQLQLNVSAQQLSQLEQFCDLLAHWNQTFNLTSITEPKDILEKHLLDSLSVAPYVQSGQQILDVGTGAGFPGVPLAIIYPNKHFTLIDSVSKKTRFLQHAQQKLALNNIEVITKRVENYHCSKCFDMILARAVATCDELLTLTTHLAKEGGHFLWMKGHMFEAELEALNQAYERKQVIPLMVPGLEATRHLVVIQKGK